MNTMGETFWAMVNSELSRRTQELQENMNRFEAALAGLEEMVDDEG